MTTPALFRPAPARQASRPAGPAITTPATTTPAITTPGTGSDEPARRDRPWWRRLPTPSRPRRPWQDIQHEGLDRLLALLEAARAELSVGWAQDGWWTTPAPGGQQILMTGLAAGPSAPETVGAVCLVGALIRAGAQQGGDSEAGRAIDVVYDALWESRGQPGGTPGAGVLTVSAPSVRQAKVQALTRWNDAPARTGDEVLAALDRAIGRVIQRLAALPAPRAPAGAPS
jgi:hypothetical protein